MDNRRTARQGEDLAAQFLSRQGCVVLQRNWRCPFGEVDIIAQEGDTLLFVEVKARRRVEYALPREAVDLRKQERLRQCAEMYLNLFCPDAPCRFDVIEVWWQSGKARLHWLREAF
ncbi:MAG: YraN family protein [Armatimonadota bacterium]|nr:YraN family protein [Armatimonadota bacterium]